jgi:hypothetical protein
MAKTYLDVNPTQNVVILDANASLGGVWSEQRLYPELISNNMLGTSEWSDFPMTTETFGVQPGEHIPGKVMHKYLRSYAEKFDLLRRIQFHSKVDTCEVVPDNTWILTINRDDGSEAGSFTMTTERLVLATGMTSEPNMPHFRGEETFDRPFFHFIDFPKHVSLPKNTKRVAVLGGAKSAWDVAYSYASAGVTVEWIIRKSGNGPIWMAPAYVTPLKKWLEKLVFTRALSWFSPCIWGDADGYGRIRSFLHGSSIGRWIVDKFWWILGNDIISLNGYGKHPETAKLKPWYDAFWVGSMLSILNYPTDFFELVRTGMIKVHIADVEKLSEGSVHLSSGEDLKVDLLCCATGWKHGQSIRFLPKDIEKEMGLPFYEKGPDVAAAKADTKIFDEFPKLKAQPSIVQKLNFPSTEGDTPNRGFKLYRFMVPPSNISIRNIGFCGMVVALSTPMVSQLQALWMTAYFAGGIASLETANEQDVEWQAQLENQYCRLRHPVSGYPDLVFDSIPYNDLLLGDLGIKSHRKKGRIAELIDPYGYQDYKGLIEEWKAIADSSGAKSKDRKIDL